MLMVLVVVQCETNSKVFDQTSLMYRIICVICVGIYMYIQGPDIHVYSGPSCLELNKIVRQGIIKS